MPRTRFEKLEPERRAAILLVAAEEFAQYGFEGASYNRIIERTGLSKGAIYYYFDDKEDLYATVLREAVQRLVLDVGQLFEAQDPRAFWREFETWYERSLRLVREEPHAIGVARSLLKALTRGSAGGAIAELRAMGRAFMERFVSHGQAVEALRSDLPRELLVSMLLGLEEGIDLWLVERAADFTDDELRATATRLTRIYKDLAAPRRSSSSTGPTTRNRR